MKDEQRRRSLIQVEIFLTYEKQLRNLQIQEARLRRNTEKDVFALKPPQDNYRADLRNAA